MRTIALLAIMGLIAAAQTPNPTPASTPAPRLNTAEVTAFQALGSRMEALKKEYEALAKQEQEVRSDACRRALGIPACDIKQDGTIVKLEAPKEEKK